MARHALAAPPCPLLECDLLTFGSVEEMSAQPASIHHDSTAPIAARYWRRAFSAGLNGASLI